MTSAPPARCISLDDQFGLIIAAMRLPASRHATRDWRSQPAAACRSLNDDAGNHWSRDRVQQCEELLQLVQPGVGNVYHVPVFDGKPLREEEGIGIAHIEAVDDR